MIFCRFDERHHHVYDKPQHAGPIADREHHKKDDHAHIPGSGL
jgi:hypothetical protein